MNLYSADIPITATVYVKAQSEEEAKALIAGMSQTSLEVRTGTVDYSWPISGHNYDDPRLPTLSLSPAMTIGKLVGIDVDLDHEDVPEGEAA